MKWILVKEYVRFNIWLNTKGGYKECFDKDEDPNVLKEENVA